MDEEHVITALTENANIDAIWSDILSTYHDKETVVNNISNLKVLKSSVKKNTSGV